MTTFEYEKRQSSMLYKSIELAHKLQLDSFKKVETFLPKFEHWIVTVSQHSHVLASSKDVTQVNRSAHALWSASRVDWRVELTLFAASKWSFVDGRIGNNENRFQHGEYGSN